ncbi:MAG: hypothetical protein Q9159_003020 [Coniocarpon cinnabarinum]
MASPTSSAKPRRASHPAQKQPSISNYGRISKPLSPPSSGKKPISHHSNENLESLDRNRLSVQTSAKRKREDDEDAITASDKQSQPVAKQVKTLQQDTTSLSCATPTKPRSNPQNLPTPETTPTKPLSPSIKPTSSTRGQQRLLDLRSLAADAQKSQNANSTDAPDSSPHRKATALQSRSTSLYDRLRAKSMQRANAPAPLSPEAIERRNALRRLPDVVRVLAMPPAKKTQARGSYSLKSLVGRVQVSARSPMGAREIERCLRLLEEEGERLGAVGFVRFVRTEKMVAVTVDARARPLEIERRVAEAVEEVR